VGLTTNLLSAGWTVTLAGYINPLNGIFATENQIGSADFNAIGTHDVAKIIDAGSGPYSVTALYTITAPAGSGSANSTVKILDQAIPEPASLALLGVALAGFGIIARRRRTVT